MDYLLSQLGSRASGCLRSHQSSRSRLLRNLSTSPQKQADQNTPSAITNATRTQDYGLSSLGNLGSTLRKTQTRSDSLSSDNFGFGPLYGKQIEQQPPHHLHIYATRHNTHITLTKPDRDPIISVSCGNLGFRKAARGTYDAAYQLGAYTMGRIQEQGLLTQIQKLELILRGFGPGREAITKILLGSEGMNLRPRVCKVTDATRLKFGGTRSKKPRRLG